MTWRTDGTNTWNTEDGYKYVDWPFDIHTHGWPCRDDWPPPGARDKNGRDAGEGMIYDPGEGFDI